jgi:hypothetical protein
MSRKTEVSTRAHQIQKPLLCFSGPLAVGERKIARGTTFPRTAPSHTTHTRPSLSLFLSLFLSSLFPNPMLVWVGRRFRRFFWASVLGSLLPARMADTTYASAPTQRTRIHTRVRRSLLPLLDDRAVSDEDGGVSSYWPPHSHMVR